MKKFLVIVKREYIQRVRSRMFIVVTILGPLMMSLFGIVPAFVLNIRAGGPVRIAVVDQTGRLFKLLESSLVENESAEDSKSNPENLNLLNANKKEQLQRLAKKQEIPFDLENISGTERPIEEIKAELNDRVRTKQIDGYLLLPSSVLTAGNAEFFGRNIGDEFTSRHLRDALSSAVRETRFTDAGIKGDVVRQLSTPVELQSIKIGEQGIEKDSGVGFFPVFALGFVIYLTVLMYGQMILGAVIEEKETRIAEILFSSVRPFALMLGKLIGVSLIALTQLTVWVSAFVAFAVLAGNLLVLQELPFHIPKFAWSIFIYFGLFFLVGYFVYSTIYALVGSMVTTTQEGGQLAMPVILLLVMGIYLTLPVIRRPDSSFALWMSLIPFFSPMTMLVRIVAQRPAFWQIALSLLLGFGTAGLLMWLAARVYRIGMLMHGKRATIPEVMRWLRQP